MRKAACSFAFLLLVIVSAGPLPAQDATPAELVATYDSMANSILATRTAEWNLIRSILAATYGHAEAAYGKAMAAMKSGSDAKAGLESLAALVAQLGNEGDASVAAVRKRLIEGGHHHNAKGEQQGVYDEGFVIVTRTAKKVFLDAAGRIGRMAASPDPVKLEAEWKTVRDQFEALMKESRRKS